MKTQRPNKKKFTRPFDKNLVLFDSKGYVKALDPYVDELEKVKTELLNEIEDFLWRVEQRKVRGGQFLQRELNDIDNFKRIVKRATE